LRTRLILASFLAGLLAILVGFAVLPRLLLPLCVSSNAAPSGPAADAMSHRLAMACVGFALAALVIGFLFNWFAANDFLRPLRWVASILQRTPPGELPQRLRTRSVDEAGELIRALNATFKGGRERISQLKEAETTLRAALAHMADGMAAFDSEGRILIFNHAAEDLFGRTAIQAQGRSLLEVTLHRDLDALVNEALRTGAPGEAEIELRRPAFKILRAYVTPIPGEDSPIFGATLVLQDLTEIRRLEDMRRDFVTNASHELKTPLATIGVMVDTLRSGMSEDPEMAARFLGTIAAEVRRLGALVDDLLDLSRIESGNVLMEREALSLRAVLRQVTQTFLPEAESRNQTLTHDASADAIVWADPNAIIRIASNLVENALKYTPDHGKITVSCGEDDDRAFLRVADTGIGISDTAKSRIFERFYRADKARSRATGGTGLGLSIVKHLAESHDGFVQVESEPGRGSTFTVWLPALSEEDWTEA
jgi:two-component system phosphate regulon sensor histidine kinase PhoR